MKRVYRYLVALLLLAMAASLSGCATPQPAAAPVEPEAPAETITLGPRPDNLEGKTVVLRWNSKVNGDILLNRLAEHLIAEVPGIIVIKLWEDDPSTAIIPVEQAESEELAAKIAALEPDLVIASQGDGGRCTTQIVVDQLRLEKLGIPTVTFTTTNFVERAKAASQENAGVEIPFVVFEHPIAGHDPATVQSKLDDALPDIMAAATAG